MLQLSASLLNQPILSLRTGGKIATTSAALINPNNLKIEGFFCQDAFDKKELVLLAQEIRDVIKQGMVVNDHDALTDPQELVRLKDIMALGFDLIGKQVVTVSKERLGKIGDWAADTSSMYIQKIYVTQSLIKSLSGGSLSIDRGDIVEITDKKIVVNEILRPTPAGARAQATAS